MGTCLSPLSLVIPEPASAMRRLGMRVPRGCRSGVVHSVNDCPRWFEHGTEAGDHSRCPRSSSGQQAQTRQLVGAGYFRHIPRPVFDPHGCVNVADELRGKLRRQRDHNFLVGLHVDFTTNPLDLGNHADTWPTTSQVRERERQSHQSKSTERHRVRCSGLPMTAINGSICVDFQSRL